MAITIFIEGDNTGKRGDLRKGFSSLFAQESKLEGKMSRIIMGASKEQTLRKGNNEPLGKAWLETT